MREEFEPPKAEVDGVCDYVFERFVAVADIVYEAGSLADTWLRGARRAMAEMRQ